MGQVLSQRRARGGLKGGADLSQWTQGGEGSENSKARFDYEAEVDENGGIAPKIHCPSKDDLETLHPLLRDAIEMKLWPDLLKPGSIWTRISRASWFENGALLVIVANAAWIAIDLETRDPDKDADGGYGENTIGTGMSPFFAVEQIFCVLFSAEICIRYLAYTKAKAFWIDPAMAMWNIFDFVLVAMMVLENWVIPYLPIGGANLSQLSVLRLLRLLRISRIFRMIPELGMMVKSMTAAFRSVSSTIMLAIGVMYVFSIIFTQWAKGEVKSLDKEIAAMDAGTRPTTFRDQAVESRTNLWLDFGHLGYSYLSLLAIMIGDDAFAITRRVFELDGLMGFVAIIFMCVGSFTVLNMLIGVICEIVSDTKAQEEDKMFITQCIDVFDVLDKDGNGILTKQEFNDGGTIMRKLGLDAQTGGTAFDLLDTDGSGSLEMYEFIDMLLKLMHPPQTQDILNIKANISSIVQKICPESAARLSKRTKSRPGEDSFMASNTAFMGRELTGKEAMLFMLKETDRKLDDSLNRLDEGMDKIERVEMAMKAGKMIAAH